MWQVNRANETIQCENCDRILEERYNDFRVAAVNVERESPYCVVTHDALAEHKSLAPSFPVRKAASRHAFATFHLKCR